MTACSWLALVGCTLFAAPPFSVSGGARVWCVRVIDTNARTSVRVREAEYLVKGS